MLLSICTEMINACIYIVPLYRERYSVPVIDIQYLQAHTNTLKHGSEVPGSTIGSNMEFIVLSLIYCPYIPPHDDCTCHCLNSGPYSSD